MWIRVAERDLYSKLGFWPLSPGSPGQLQPLSPGMLGRRPSASSSRSQSPKIWPRSPMLDPNVRIKVEQDADIIDAESSPYDDLKFNYGIKKKKPSDEELCLICGDRASGYHYNALSCEGCKGKLQTDWTVSGENPSSWAYYLFPQPSYDSSLSYPLCLLFFCWKFSIIVAC